MRHVLMLIAATLVVLCLSLPVTADETRKVDVSLVLAIDVSSSISEGRWNLQMSGYAQAFMDAKIAELVATGVYGAIDVTAFVWAGCSSQKTIIGWTTITDSASAKAFAKKFSGVRRPFDGNTCPAAALAFAGEQFASAPHRALKLVTDISGDGGSDVDYHCNGRVVSTAEVRDQLVARDVTVNGLALIVPNDIELASGSRDSVPVVQFYREEIIGGRGAFLEVVLDADSQSDFVAALRKKLAKELLASR